MLAVGCKDAGFLIRIVVKLLKYLHIIIPALLIVLVVFDLSKVVIGQVDDKAKKDAVNKIVKRVIYSIIIFFIPTIIMFIFRKVDDIKPTSSGSDESATTWITCFIDEYDK